MNDTRMSLFGLKTGGSIIKSKGQMLKDATLKIGELQREREVLMNRLCYLMVAVNALGGHFKLEAHQAKEIIQKFIKDQDVNMQAQADMAKEKFKADLAAGKMPEGFKVVDNIEKAN